MLPSRARDADDEDTDDEDVVGAGDGDAAKRVLVTRVRGGDFLPNNRLFKTDCPQILLLAGS